MARGEESAEGGGRARDRESISIVGTVAIVITAANVGTDGLDGPLPGVEGVVEGEGERG